MEKKIIFRGEWKIGEHAFPVPNDRVPIVKYEELKKVMQNHASGDKKSQGGWVGFLSYELGSKFLRVPRHQSDVPEVYFIYCPELVLTTEKNVHARAQMGINGLQKPRNPTKSLPGQTLTKHRVDPSFVPGHNEASLADKLRSVRTDFSRLPIGVHEIACTPSLGVMNPQSEEDRGGRRLYSNLTYPQYEKKLQTIKNYLFNGDTYQVNFSQRFSTPWKGDPYELFQKISKLNPSPYQFFCEGELPAGKNFAVISNSPELLVRGTRTGKGMRVETRPIKGTVPRGKNSQENAKNIRQLLNSKKDEAELSMIVDLERNDLGRVCIPHTIHVRDHRAIEEYSHVIHTSSTVEGMLDPRRNVFDVIESVFPGGSITGCPKKRTMEIIDELEDFPRGVYCGSAGYILDDGTFEFNIMIRTMFLQGGKIYFHSGGGIVVDSDPKMEYAETLHKAGAFRQTVENQSP